MILTQCADGYDISESASYAASKIIWPWDNVKDYEILGDDETHISYEVNDKQNTVSYVPTYLYYYQSVIPNELYNINIINNPIPLNDELNYQKEDLEYIYYDQKVERNHLVINGILTNVYYDTINDGNIIINTSREEMTKEDIIFLENIKNDDYKFSEIVIANKFAKWTVTGIEKHFVYIKHDGEVFPVMIFYVDLNFEGSDINVQKVLCYNVLTKEEIKYEDFSFDR